MPPIILYKLLQHAILDGDLPLVKKIMLRNCVQDIPDPATGAPLCFFAIRTGQTEILAYLVSIKRDNRIDKVSSIYAGFQRQYRVDGVCRCKELRSRQALKQAFQICVAAFPNTIGLVFLSDKGQQGGIDCVAADYDTRPIRHDESNEISGRNCWLLAPIRMNATRMDQRHCICKITFNSSAAAWGRPDFFTPLVEFGADSKLVNSKGWTVADYSYSQKIAELVQSKLFAKH